MTTRASANQTSQKSDSVRDWSASEWSQITTRINWTWRDVGLIQKFHYSSNSPPARVSICLTFWPARYWSFRIRIFPVTVTCTGTDNRTRKTKRQNTGKTKSVNIIKLVLLKKIFLKTALKNKPKTNFANRSSLEGTALVNIRGSFDK